MNQHPFEVMTIPTTGPASAPQPLARTQVTPMHLLLLEDDIDLGQAVAEHLEAQGHTVSWLKTCEQADRAMTQPDIELALLDLRLPDMSGHEIMDFINAKGIDGDVIVMSGDVGIEAAEGRRCLQSLFTQNEQRRTRQLGQLRNVIVAIFGAVFLDEACGRGEKREWLCHRQQLVRLSLVHELSGPVELVAKRHAPGVVEQTCMRESRG